MPSTGFGTRAAALKEEAVGPICRAFLERRSVLRDQLRTNRRGARLPEPLEGLAGPGQLVGQGVAVVVVYERRVAPPAEAGYGRDAGSASPSPERDRSG